MKPMPIAIALASALLLTACVAKSESLQSLSGSATPAVTISPSSPIGGHMITARTRHTATPLPSGAVLVVGGAPVSLSGPALANAEIYDLATNSWSRTARL